MGRVKRKGLRTSAMELRKLADEMEDDLRMQYKELGIKFTKECLKQGWILPIINKDRMKNGKYCCDTWSFEK